MTNTPSDIYNAVHSYIASVPDVTRGQFDALREIVRNELPEANEVFSYGIIGYKVDAKRARVYISGWKDHVAMYPIPADEALRSELQTYIKGKGTLWFSLSEPLPEQLLRRTVRALTE